MCPDAIIRDQLSDGQNVVVELYLNVEQDDFGIPILSKWAFIAFRHSQRHKEKRKKYIEEKGIEVKSFQRERSETARLRKVRENQSRAYFTLSQILPMSDDLLSR